MVTVGTQEGTFYSSAHLRLPFNSCDDICHDVILLAELEVYMPVSA